MYSIAERVQKRIQDPKLTTSMNAYSPRRHDLCPPTTIAVVEKTEILIGFSLPQLLRELFTEVANGGFGPGYGIFGLEGGFTDPLIIDLGYEHAQQGGTLVDWYFAFRGTGNGINELDSPFNLQDGSSLILDPESGHGERGWFDKLLPISNHGCWQISCVDCSKPEYPVLFFEGQQSELWLECLSFDQWIENWLNSDI